MPGLDLDSGDGTVSFLAVDEGLVRHFIDSIAVVVTEAPMGSVIASVGNQIVHNFLLQFRPNGVSKHENALDLVLRMEKGIAGATGDAAAKSAKKILCLNKVCWLFPLLVCHDVLRVREKAEEVTQFGHCWVYLLKIGVVGYCQKRSEMSWKECSICERVREESRTKGGRFHSGDCHIVVIPSCCFSLVLVYGLVGVVSIDSLVVLCRCCRALVHSVAAGNASEGVGRSE